MRVNMSINTDPPAGGGSAASVGGPVIFTLKLVSRLLPLFFTLLLLCHSVMAQPSAVEGATTTTLAVWVNAEGAVRRVEIRKSCGRRECDAAAVSRALALQFPPSVDAATQSAPRLFVIGSDVKELAQ